MNDYQSRFAVRNGKRPVTGLGNKGPLNVLNCTKLITQMIMGITQFGIHQVLQRSPTPPIFFLKTLLLPDDSPFLKITDLSQCSGRWMKKKENLNCFYSIFLKKRNSNSHFKCICKTINYTYCFHPFFCFNYFDFKLPLQHLCKETQQPRQF